jgi:hypothetical protein
MEESQTKSLSPWTIAALLLMFVIPLYVLSIGPATYLLNHGFLASYRAGEVFYAPLLWAAEHCDPLDYALKRYIAWWLG